MMKGFKFEFTLLDIDQWSVCSIYSMRILLINKWATTIWTGYASKIAFVKMFQKCAHHRISQKFIGYFFFIFCKVIATMIIHHSWGGQWSMPAILRKIIILFWLISNRCAIGRWKLAKKSFVPFIIYTFLDLFLCTFQTKSPNEFYHFIVIRIRRDDTMKRKKWNEI